MKNQIILLASALVAATATAEETVVEPKLESVGLFKNGLAVVRLSFPVNGPGDYRWQKVPKVVHGSMWVESDGIVSVKSTTRLVEETPESESLSGSLQQDLAGKNVTVSLKSSSSTRSESFSGVVWKVPAQELAQNWNTNYSSLNPNNGSYYWHRSQLNARAVAGSTTPDAGNFLVMSDGEGNRRYIDRSSIASLNVRGPFKPTTRETEKPVLIFNVSKIPTKGATVQLSYLTKGLAWLPAYQVDLSDPDSMRIRQSAVVRNEMDELKDTEIQLISGYPNVRFGAVDSPIWPGTTLASFFQQVNQSGSTAGGIHSQGIASNQLIYMNSSAPANVSSPLPDIGEEGRSSDDIHYESIGTHSMKAGDSLSLDVASAQADYKRVVKWVVPDPRDARGRYQNRSQQNIEDQAWDAVRFNNPFEFPMTTAAALVVEKGKFRGQSLSTWVNPGQETCLRITRALSIRTESSEVEEEGKREMIWIGGNDYQRTTVSGRLFVQNFRGKEVALSIRGEFSGKLIESDGNPKKSLRTEGIASVNPRRQLDWDLTLPAGEEITLEYRYEVLVDR